MDSWEFFTINYIEPTAISGWAGLDTLVQPLKPTNTVFAAKAGHIWKIYATFIQCADKCEGWRSNNILYKDRISFPLGKHVIFKFNMQQKLEKQVSWCVLDVEKASMSKKCRKWNSICDPMRRWERKIQTSLKDIVLGADQYRLTSLAIQNKQPGKWAFPHWVMNTYETGLLFCIRAYLYCMNMNT